MDKVSVFVREKLLQYPTLYENRLQVLCHLFMVNGNGFDWDENTGCPVEWADDGRRSKTKMYYADLKKKIKNSEESLKEYDLDLYRFWIAEAKQEIAARKHRAKHIDLYAVYNNDNFKYEHLDRFSPEWSLFGTAPYGKIDPEWARAMEEVIEKIMYAFNTIWHLHLDRPSKGAKLPSPSMFSRMPQEWQKKYNEIAAYRDKLDEQTGTRKNRAEALKDFFAAIEK